MLMDRTRVWRTGSVGDFFDNIRRMFDELRFRYQRWRILKTYRPSLRKAHGLKDRDEFEIIASEQSTELDLLDSENDVRRSWQLIRKAESLDISRPKHGEESWEQVTGGMTLKPEPRSKLRQQVDAEITRRREVTAWWWKNVVIPAITALTGLAGVINWYDRRHPR
jgi:hypothetical protein